MKEKSIKFLFLVFVHFSKGDQTYLAFTEKFFTNMNDQTSVLHQIADSLQKIAGDSTRVHEICPKQDSMNSLILNTTAATNTKLNHLQTIFEEWIIEAVAMSVRQEELIQKKVTETVEGVIVNITEQLSSVIEKTSDTEGAPHYRNCLEIQNSGVNQSGLYTIYPYMLSSSMPVQVYCDLTRDGGGWTVFQRRGPFPPHRDFKLGWKSYVEGFGNPQEEFWLGLENIRALVTQTPMELRFDLEDFENNKRYAKYSEFSIGDSMSFYKLKVFGFCGDISDDFHEHNGHSFSTIDNDHDGASGNCAEVWNGGGWWYTECHPTCLNGIYYPDSATTKPEHAKGIVWRDWKGYDYSLKYTEMKVRPRQIEE